MVKSYDCGSQCIVCKNEKFLAITISGNNFPKKIWMRVVQTRSDANQPDKTTAGSPRSQSCCSWPRTTWSRGVYGKEVF